MGLLVLGTIPWWSGCSSDGTASVRGCDEVNVTVSPEVASPGSTITVAGSSLNDPCVGTTAVGTTGASLRVYLLQGSADVSLALVQAAPDGTFSIDVGVPDTVVAGSARVVVRRATEPDGTALAGANLTINGA